jgi:hypothetical protein
MLGILTGDITVTCSRVGASVTSLQLRVISLRGQRWQSQDILSEL